VDQGGKPYISFESDVMNLAVASKTGDTWTVEVVDPTSMNGLYSSMVIDRSGQPHIIYIGNRFYSLMVAVKLSMVYSPFVKK
jgi:hypothetical protein